MMNICIMIIRYKKHRGEIVEKAIRESGYSLTVVSKKLGISRNTLYNKFEDPNLNDDFIYKVSQAIHYDFSIHLPELNQIEKFSEVSQNLFKDKTAKDYKNLYTKYTDLLEKHNELMRFLIKMANDNELQTLKKEIASFMEEDKKYE
jgi:lambda repressor-like predicted transcriptional regulator